MAELKSTLNKDLAKLIAQNDPNAIAEGTKRGLLKDNQLVQGWQNIADPKVETPQIPQTPQPTINQPSISDLMTQQSNEATSALLNALKQRISESKAAQQQIIAKTPQQYDPLRAQSEVAKSQQLRTALERSSLLGDRGGVGRSEALATQTAGENRLNAINLQQQNQIDNANAEIARLESEGKFQEAQIVAQQKAQLLQNLLGERLRQEEISRADTLKQDELARGETTANRQMELDTLTRYSNDYQAEINRRQSTPDTTDDWLIPYLQTARQDKIKGISDAETQAKLAQENAAIEFENQTYDRAIQKWGQGIPLNADEASILGVSVGATKPKASSGGGGGLTSSQQWNRIKDKIELGIPLTAEEEAILGGTPQASVNRIKIGDAQAAIDNAVDRIPTQTTEENILGNQIKRDIPGYQLNQKQAAALELVKLVQNDLIDEATETQLMARYGLTDGDIDNAIRKLIPTGGK